MADDIVQTIKIQVEGADQAAADINKVGAATKDVEKAANQTVSGTGNLAKGMDEVAKKSSISGRELRALSKVAHEFGADFASAGLGLVRMAAIRGPLGAAVFALGEAISFVGKKMKEMKEEAKAVTGTFANIAKIAAESNLEDQARFWGTTADAMKKAANDAGQGAAQFQRIKAGAKEASDPLTTRETQQQACIKLLQQQGIAVGDVMADTKKLGQESQKAALEAAKIYEKLSPIERLNFEKTLKGLGFTDQQIKN